MFGVDEVILAAVSMNAILIDLVSNIVSLQCNPKRPYFIIISMKGGLISLLPKESNVGSHALIRCETEFGTQYSEVQCRLDLERSLINGDEIVIFISA